MPPCLHHWDPGKRTRWRFVQPNLSTMGKKELKAEKDRKKERNLPFWGRPTGRAALTM